MALLDGILGGAQSAQAFGQQRFQNNLAQDKFAEQKRQYDQSYNESVRQFNINDVYNNANEARLTDEEARTALTRSNDKIYDTFKVGGYVAKDGMSLNYDKINTDLAAGDGNAEQIILGFATQFGNLPEGSKATAVQALEGGGYAITVQNADGTQGVVTEDGSSNPDSNVLRFEPGQLGKLANTNFQREILTNTSRFNATTQRNNLDVIDADFDQQALNDRLVDLRYEQSVVAALPPEPGARRAAEAAIQSGGQETVKMIGNDLGVPKPVALDDSESTSEVTPTIAPFDMKNVDRSTKGGQLIASIEGLNKRSKSANPMGNRNASTPDTQRSKLEARKTELENSIRTAEKLRAGSPNLKIDPKKDRLPKNKAELDQINSYLEKDKPAVFTQAAETDAVAEQAAGKTTEEIAAGVNDGTIKVDQPTVQRVAQELQAAGIKEIRDLKRLTAKDAAIARAAIIASTDNPTIAARMTQEMVNIFDNVENSPSVNRKDELGLADKSADRSLKSRKMGNDARIAYRGWMKEATEEAKKVVAGVNKRYFGENYDENNLDADTASAVMKSKEMSDFQIYLKNPGLTPGEIKTAVVGLKSVMSTTMAALAGDESGGAWESILDLLGRDETEDVVDAFDFDASRIIVDDPDNPTKIYYTNADGSYTDEDAGLQKLKDLAPSFYENVRAIGIANRRARDKQPAAQG
mgnify:CR=1 FL=1|tara:strand:- start:760 stop:2844 length:2085 start_codon:yes stop_codon:yes gene_type:complete